MSRAFCYFRLQLKRFFKQAIAVLLLSILLLGVMGLLLFGMVSESQSDAHNALLNVGIVGDREDTTLSLAVRGLSSMDASRFSISTRLVEDEVSAVDMIRRGDLVAYVVMPDDFFDRAFHGDVQQVRCVTADGATDFGTLITQELMMSVTELVENSQKSVYGFQQAAIDSGVQEDRALEMGTGVAYDDVRLILSRESAFAVSEIGTGGDSSVKDVYWCGIIVLFWMVWGVTCCTVFHARSRTLNKVLSSKGTGAVMQVMGEYTAYLIFMTAAMGIFALLVWILSPLFPESLQSSQYEYAATIGGSIVPILTLSSLQFFLYEITDELVPGVLLQFCCAIGMGYLCGCLYPSYLFPRAVQDFASWMPAWRCRIWLDELLAGRASLRTFLFLFGFFLLFLLLSVFVRRMRIRRKGGAA